MIGAERSLRRAVPQRHKSYRIKHGQLPPIGSASFNQVERLPFSSRHWRNQAPSDLHLLKPGLGNALARGGGDHQIIRCGLGYAQLAVTKDEAQVGNTQAAKVSSGLLMQTPNAFDGYHFAKQAGEHGRLITAARSNFQHTRGRPGRSLKRRSQELDHPGDGKWPRDGLRMADGEGHVFVGPARQSRFDKAVPGHVAHDLKHAGIAYPGSPQALHHGKPNRF